MKTSSLHLAPQLSLHPAAGISLYCGLETTLADNLKLLRAAARLGFTRLFTSLQLPEADPRRLRGELPALLAAARSCSLDVSADISPQAAQVLGLRDLKPNTLAALGITCVRCDCGFTPGEIAAYSRRLQVQLNASTLDAAALKNLAAAGAIFQNLQALHNFYPRRHTGLSAAYLQTQNEFLAAYGLTVGAFIASQNGRRGPLYDGLPTLEGQRRSDVKTAAGQLLALGVSSIYIGDDKPSLLELQELADTVRAAAVPSLAAAARAPISPAAPSLLPLETLPIRLLTSDPWTQKLLRHTFTLRTDPAQEVLRTQESRSLVNGHRISPEGTPRPLQLGDLTLDNQNYGRYLGELQIILVSLETEARTNLVGQVLPEAQARLSCLKPGQKFRFLF